MTSYWRAAVRFRPTALALLAPAALASGALAPAALAGQGSAPAPPPAHEAALPCRADTRPPAAAAPSAAPTPGDEARLQRAADAAARAEVGRVRALARARGWVGIRTSELSEFRWDGSGRVICYRSYPVVESVEPASPAERGGLAAGDTIVAYQGRDLVRDGPIALDRLLVPGQTLAVRVRRDGRTTERQVVIAPRPAVLAPAFGGREFLIAPAAPPPPEVLRELERRRALAAGDVARAGTMAVGSSAPTARRVPPLPPAPFAVSIDMGGPAMLAGAQLIALDDDLRAALADAPQGNGVLVLRVLPETPAADAGLRPGDVIVRAAGQLVSAPRAIHAALVSSRESRTLALRVERRGSGRDVTLRW